MQDVLIRVNSVYNKWQLVIGAVIYYSSQQANRGKTYIIIIIWSPLCKAGREWEHSISPKTPTPHNQPMEGR